MHEVSSTYAAAADIHSFRSWLNATASGWYASNPEVGQTSGGTTYAVFSLYCNGLPVAMCESPSEALEKIGDDSLTARFLGGSISD